ncbi:nucleoside phosphorylase [Phaeocystidibacter marisrubri]|nr:nucleoside phosphorylase [Phaeocystidibacter marisrubri]
MKRNMLGPSELILNSDGSVYHLNLLPEDISTTIITVGDPHRVGEVSKHFDAIELVRENREFVTHTGTYKGKRITVISTGIGTDNVDIVLNELDALVNIDLNARMPKSELTSLDFVRIGTSGALQSDIPLGTWLLSSSAFGYDDLLHFYSELNTSQEAAEDLQKYIGRLPLPYRAAASTSLSEVFPETDYKRGHTLTMPGFYAPQGRALRIGNPTADIFHKFAEFELEDGSRLTNLEMETAGLYGLAELLGHRAVSISVLLANRMNGEFHDDPKGAMENLILHTLNCLVS